MKSTELAGYRAAWEYLERKSHVLCQCSAEAVEEWFWCLVTAWRGKTDYISKPASKAQSELVEAGLLITDEQGRTYDPEIAAYHKQIRKRSESGRKGGKARIVETEAPLIEKCPYGEIMSLWNALATELGLATITKMNLERKRKAKMRWLEWKLEGWPDIWQLIAEGFRQWPWGRGENDREWKVDFDYLIRNDTNWRKSVERIDTVTGNRNDGFSI